MGDWRIEIKPRMAAADIAAVSALIDEVVASDHHQPLGDHKWLDLVHGGRRGFTGFLAYRDSGALVGYAQLTKGNGSWGLEVVVHPAYRVGPASVGRSLLGAALEEVRKGGGGHLNYWVPKPSASQDADAAALGLRKGRDLFQMRTPLPLPPDVRASALPIEVRAFRPGVDEVAWLEVNNRAFADHPEQGGWDIETLLEREREPWFDPSGFLVYEHDGRLTGSCWTKIHRDTEPALGEIYVISVDPESQQRGLGRSLTVAGLDWLAGAGLSVGMLYVDSANVAALALYRSLGFAVDHLDRAYGIDIKGD